MDIRLTHTHHLVALIAEASSLAARLHDAGDDALAALARDARIEAARLSARLDGSPLEPATADAVDAGTWAGPTVAMTQERAGGWATALRLDGLATQEVAAVEYTNLRAAYDAEADLAQRIFDEPLATLGELHGLLCQGLVEPEVVGRLRTTEQALHDGAQGKVIFNTPDPAALPPLMAGLQSWLRGEHTEGSAAFTAPVVAAIVHEALLQWQPYEAANGRVARSAARLVLRARDLDPHGVAVLERQWAADAGGYYGEVAATIRRRGDLTPWVERHTQALVDALASALEVVRPARPAVPQRALEVLDRIGPAQTLTVAEYAGIAGISRETAGKELRALAAAGHMVREPRTLGRRFRRC